MIDEDSKTIKRLRELSDRAQTRGGSTYSEFLTLAEQALLPQAVGGNCSCLFGGWEGAERRIACFGEDAEALAPIICLRISPLSAKFAEELGHRDYLGALMSLGIRREVLGDILISEGSAYLFCLDSISDFIVSELTQIRRTSVRCERVDALPETAVPQPEEKEIVVSSVRLDSLVSPCGSYPARKGRSLYLRARCLLTEKRAFPPLLSHVKATSFPYADLVDSCSAEWREKRKRGASACL